jgi:hypothetical protein
MMMAYSFEDFISNLKSHLTADELANSVAYAAEAPFAAGTQLQFPGTLIEVPSEAYLAFVDRQPMANWGHSARYLLISRESGESQSFETHLPPFRPGSDLRWRVVYKAPSVPDAAVAIPQ